MRTTDSPRSWCELSRAQEPRERLGEEWPWHTSVHFSRVSLVIPCFCVIILLFDPRLLRTLMTWRLYPLSYSSFTLFHFMNWGPDRFLWDFWWLYANYRFQREVSSPSLPSSASSLLNSIRCLPSLDSGVTLGARMHLSRVYMVITLWFFKDFAQQKTPGYMLSFFEKKTPLWLPCTQGSNCDYIWKENSTKTSGFFVKENPGFFHNFVHNVSTLCYELDPERIQ